MFRWLANRPWGRVALMPVVLGALAWSQFTYLLFGIPKDKVALYDKYIGWLEPEMDQYWQAYLAAKDAGQKFHELKNIGVEWTRANAQPVAKAGALLLTVLVVLWLGSISLSAYLLLS